MFKLKNNKGVTLIELVIALSLSSIVATLVCTTLITSNKISEEQYNSVEIQEQGHFIMEFIYDKVIQSNKIDSVLNYSNVYFYNTDKSLDLGEVKFKDATLPGNKGHVFSIQKDPKVEGKSIRYGNLSPPTIELGNYIDSVYIKPLPEGSLYSDAKGIKINIKMKKGTSVLNLSKSIYFRNVDQR